MAQVRVIKKYPNRRLYDTEISSYITLEEVRQLVIDGEDFEVRDAKSGEDLTRSVLLQIIAEHEQTGQPMFTTQLLSQIIRFYGDSMQGFMGSYLVDVERHDRAQPGFVEIGTGRLPQRRSRQGRPQFGHGQVVQILIGGV